MDARNGGAQGGRKLGKSSHQTTQPSNGNGKPIEKVVAKNSITIFQTKKKPQPKEDNEEPNQQVPTVARSQAKQSQTKEKDVAPPPKKMKEKITKKEKWTEKNETRDAEALPATEAASGEITKYK